MTVTKTIADCHTARKKLGRVALVPTMGALHQGHIRLVEIAREHAEHVAVSIFVNPTQFGPRDDYSRYPRPVERDLEMCRKAGVELVFNPTASEMYPGHAETEATGEPAPQPQAAQAFVDLPQLSSVLEGRFRPGHFQGVCQVVAKLFNIVQPDAACFGQKDYQQLLILTRMVEELNWPIQIIACPTVRDADGLAVSSRNQYLSSTERQRALSISRGLFAAQKDFDAGERQANRLVTTVQRVLLEDESQAQMPLRIDYVAAADARTLKNVEMISAPTVLAVAARVGKTRLIDNTVLTP